MIMEYMRAQNRPFNAIMLQQNLHGAVSLAQAKKFLTQLASEGKLTELLNKKQSIYWVNQDGLEVVDAKELREFDERLKELKEEDTALGKELDALAANIKGIAATLTNEQLEAEIPIVEKRVAQKRERAETLKEGVVEMDPAQRKALETNREKYRKAWSTRKRIVMKDVIPQMQESFPVDMDLIETDDQAGVDFNNSAMDRFYAENGGAPPAAGGSAPKRAKPEPVARVATPKSVTKKD